MVAKKKPAKKKVVKLPEWIDVNEDGGQIKFRIEFTCPQSELEDVLDNIRQCGEVVKVEKRKES